MESVLLWVWLKYLHFNSIHLYYQTFYFTKICSCYAFYTKTQNSSLHIHLDNICFEIFLQLKKEKLVLEGDFDPKNFMDQIDGVDKSGNPVPDWKKQMLARNLAEKAFKEYEEKRKVRNNQLKILCDKWQNLLNMHLYCRSRDMWSKMVLWGFIIFFLKKVYKLLNI